MKDLRELPRLSDSISYLYIERAVIEQEAASVTAYRKDERIPIPIATISALFLGPGTSITHAAVKTIAESGCTLIWCGEGVSRFYASGMGDTRSAENLLRQASLCMDVKAHMEVVKRMYIIRFPKISCEGKSLQQIRGMEGIRVREAYKLWSKNTGVPWRGRTYKNDDWDDADEINQAVSIANTVLYGVCHAAIISLGYSPALGFVHTGKQLSFVYDIADLYKANVTIPAAFSAIARRQQPIDIATRTLTREYIKKHGIMKRIAGDIAWVLSSAEAEDINQCGAGKLWDDNKGAIDGGINYAQECDDNW